MLLLAAFLYIYYIDAMLYLFMSFVHKFISVCVCRWGWSGVCAVFSHNLCTNKFGAFVNVLPDLLWFSAVSIFGNVIHNNSMSSGIWAHHSPSPFNFGRRGGDGSDATTVLPVGVLYGVPLSHPVHFQSPRRRRCRNWFSPFLFLDTFAVCLLCIYSTAHPTWLRTFTYRFG